MTKKERLEKYLKYKGIKPTPAARALGISNSHISEINTRKNNRTLYMAIQSNPDFLDCNTEWIDTGTGEMLLNKYSQSATLRHESVAAEMAVKYSGSTGESPRMAVKELKREVTDEGWALLDCFEALCEEQRQSLLIVAKTMAMGLPGKSPQKD